ncbi:MAG: hypothetical protein JNJ77_04705 [Planctomycetia bacterium]|nr:hypothetical protein [Planctomycetia bacterium]
MNQQQKDLWKKKLHGWEMLARRERAIAVAQTAHEKLEEICSLQEFAKALPVSRQEERELKEVRQRWIKIKRGKKKN